MTNEEWIKSRSTEQLASMLNYPISCNDLCDKHEAGCIIYCPYHGGQDVFVKWLKEERQYG